MLYENLQVLYDIYTTCFDQSDHSICNNYDLKYKSHHYQYSAVKGRRYHVIIRIRVEYELYFVYGRADRKVNDVITLEHSKIYESKTL